MKRRNPKRIVANPTTDDVSKHYYLKMIVETAIYRGIFKERRVFSRAGEGVRFMINNVTKENVYNGKIFK